MYRILVIDKDKLVRWSIKEIMSKDEFIVDETDSVKEALKMQKKEFYNLVLADFDLIESNAFAFLKNGNNKKKRILN